MTLTVAFFLEIAAHCDFYIIALYKYVYLLAYASKICREFCRRSSRRSSDDGGKISSRLRRLHIGCLHPGAWANRLLGARCGRGQRPALLLVILITTSRHVY